jgi:hypothetical protein
LSNLTALKRGKSREFRELFLTLREAGLDRDLHLDLTGDSRTLARMTAIREEYSMTEEPLDETTSIDALRLAYRKAGQRAEHEAFARNVRMRIIGGTTNSAGARAGAPGGGRHFSRLRMRRWKA